MKTLAEIIDGFKGILEEDSKKGVQEFKAYFNQQEDYTVSEQDFLNLLEKKKSIKEDPLPANANRSMIFFEVLFDYISKALPKEERQEFNGKVYKIFGGNDLTMDEEDALLNSASISLEGAKAMLHRAERLMNMFRPYTLPDKPVGPINEVAHYVNNNNTSLMVYLRELEKMKNKR